MPPNCLHGQKGKRPLRRREREKSGTKNRVTAPTTLNNGSATKSDPSGAELSGHVYPVARSLGDEIEVHSTAAVEAKVTPVESKQCENSVPDVPVPWGKLSKAIVLDVFKDVHTGLGTLGPPLHISMNPSVTPRPGTFPSLHCCKRSKSSRSYP